jgi:hypothetical protein
MTGWQYREVRWRGKRNNSMEMWIGSIHGTFFLDLDVVRSTLLTVKSAIAHISEVVLFPTIYIMPSNPFSEFQAMASSEFCV